MLALRGVAGGIQCVQRGLANTALRGQWTAQHAARASFSLSRFELSCSSPSIPYREAHASAARFRAPALAQRIHPASTLTWHQALRVRRILNRRDFDWRRGARKRALMSFKRQARRGLHDQQVPMRSLFGVYMSSFPDVDTSPAALAALESKQTVADKGASGALDADTAAAAAAGVRVDPEATPVAAAAVDAVAGAEAAAGSVAADAVERGVTVRAAQQHTNMVTLPGAVFNRPVNPFVLYQVVRWQRAKRREGNASTKHRGEVRGGGRKPHAQKGSGRARQGTIRAPHMRGGSIAFGPKPRNFAFKLGKHMRKAGLMAALSQKAQQGQLVIMDRLFLSSDHARIVFKKLLYRHIDTFKQTGNYKVRPAWLRRAVLQALPPGMLTGLIGITNESGRLMTSPFNDRTIVENIMRELDHREEDYGNLMAKTGWFEQQLHKLPPAGWDAQPESVIAGSGLLAKLNNGFSEERLTRMDSRRKVKSLIKTLLVVSNRDVGYAEHTELCHIVKNIPTANVIPVKGLNVYDIMRHRTLVLSKDALDDTIERATRPVLRCFKPKGFDWKEYVVQQKQLRVTEAQRKVEIAQWLQERGIEVPKKPKRWALRTPQRALAIGESAAGPGASV